MNFCHTVKDQSEKGGEEVWVVEEDEKDRVCKSGQYRHQDDVVVVEDVAADSDDVGVGEVPFKDKRSHVDDKVDGVEANHEVSDKRSVLADRPIDAENVGVSHIESRSQVLDKPSAFDR